MSLFEKMCPTAIVPKRGTTGSAGYDLFPLDNLNGITIPAHDGGEPFIIRTGIKVNIPEGWVGLIQDRSSTGKKSIMRFMGVIDSDYRDMEILVGLVNFNKTDFVIVPGKAMAQMVIVPHYIDPSEMVNIVRTGGFGSTDVTVKENAV